MWTRRLASLAPFAAAVLLAACSQKEPKTVAYYTAHPAERYQVVAACKDNPGKFKDDPDCINANDSAIQGWGKAKLPAIGFSTPSSAAASK